MDGNNCKPHLVMVVEPETKIRFRYKSEGASHGGLIGKGKSKQKKVYPTVKLEGYKGTKPVYIKVSLYTEKEEPHVLEFLGQSNETIQCITQYLHDDGTAVFTNLKILSKKKEEVVELLADQHFKKMKNISDCARKHIKVKNDKEFKDKAKSIMNSVRLCFEAFEDDCNKPLCKPLFSELISNQKAAAKGELRIYRMSSCSGSWKGGDEIILLCGKVQKDNIEIHFYETDSSNQEIWKGKATFLPCDVHFQVAINFKTPPYKMNAEKTVFVCLARDGEVGDPVKFTYKADFEEYPSKKRKTVFSEEYVTYPMENGLVNSMPDTITNDQEMSSPSTYTPFSEDSNVSPGEFLPEGDKKFIEKLMDDEEVKEFLNNFPLNCEHLLCGPQSMTADFLTLPKPQQGMTADFSTIPETRSDTIQTDGVFKQHNFEKIQNQSLEFPIKPETLELPQCHKEKVPFKLRFTELKIRDECGNTCLHKAAYENGNMSLLLTMCLLAEIDIINLKNNNQESALHIAVQQNNKEIVEILLENHGNPNLKNAEGNNCYHIAAKYEYVEVMSHLLSIRWPDLDAYNYDGLTPLHIAVMMYSVDCYRLLKSYRADLSIKAQKTGRSLIHYAAEYQPSFVKILLQERDIDVNVQDFEGNTPLHIACATENIEVVKELLKAGANPSVMNYKENCNIAEEEISESEVDNLSNEISALNMNENSEIDGETPADLTTNEEILKLLTQASNDASSLKCLDEAIKNLCALLDVDKKWKRLAVYAMDEKYINSLECSLSPTKTLLTYIQRENPNNFAEHLKNLLEVAGLNEAVEIFK